MKNAAAEPRTDKILNAIRRQVKKQFREAVCLEARLQADLDMDSLNVLVCVLEIEKELGLSIPWDAVPANEIRTVADLVAFITSGEAPSGEPSRKHPDADG